VEWIIRRRKINIIIIFVLLRFPTKENEGQRDFMATECSKAVHKDSQA
jgi:hypothetical protein